MPLSAETEKMMRELLEKAFEEGVHMWGFTFDTFSSETGQYGNFPPSLHFDNSIKALSVLGNKIKEAQIKKRLQEN